jgi:hypothetical protein
MERDAQGSAPLEQEVVVLGGEMVAAIRALAARGVGSKRIAATLGVARHTVKRYPAPEVAVGVQRRPRRRRRSAEAHSISAGP